MYGLLLGESLPQAASAALSDTFEGWEDYSQWVCVLTPWVMQGAGFPPHHTQPHIGDTEEDRLKAGSGEERGDRGAVSRLIPMAYTLSSYTPHEAA